MIDDYGRCVMKLALSMTEIRRARAYPSTLTFGQ
jgi:hypothetical protein